MQFIHVFLVLKGLNVRNFLQMITSMYKMNSYYSFKITLCLALPLYRQKNNTRAIQEVLIPIYSRIHGYEYV